MILCALFLCMSGCNADPDVILQNEVSSEQPEEDSADLEADDSASEKDDTAAKTADAQIRQEDSSTVYMYICGAVLNPGVYELPATARIYELVEMAGGLTADADEQSVNLAQLAEDGGMIWIPTKEESAAGVTAPAGVTASDGSAASADSGGEKVNINTADAAELTTLYGFGDSKAAAIIAYRDAHGRFQSIEEIMNVDGIAEGTYEKIRDYITV